MKIRKIFPALYISVCVSAGLLSTPVSVSADPGDGAAIAENSEMFIAEPELQDTEEIPLSEEDPLEEDSGSIDSGMPFFQMQLFSAYNDDIAVSGDTGDDTGSDIDDGSGSDTEAGDPADGENDTESGDSAGDGSDTVTDNDSDGADPDDLSEQVTDEIALLQKYSDEVRTALLSGETTLTLDEELYRDQLTQFKHIGYYCPYTDGTNIRVTLSYYSSTGRYARINVKNSLSAEETAAWVAEIDASLSELESLILDPSLTTVDQALILHDYMDAHYHYDTSLTKYCPSLLLTQKTGVCQSYAYLFQYLMNEAGAECYTTVSTAMSHAWNIIRIGDQYYHIDVSNDDPLEDRYGMAKHKYFLLSDATIQDSLHNHSGWDLTQYTCGDVSYENACYVNSTSPVVISGSEFYYVDSSGLEDYSTETGTVTTLDDGIGTWPVIGTDSHWETIYSGLFLEGDTLYYNTANTIRSYNLSSGNASVYALTDASDTSGYVYGILSVNGAVYYALETSPDTIKTFDAKDIREAVPYEEPHVHEYGSGEVTTEPTCGTAGVRTFTCSCGEFYTEEIPATGEHTYGEPVTTWTDAVNGTSVYTCTVCGFSYSENVTRQAEGSSEDNKESGTQDQGGTASSETGNSGTTTAGGTSSSGTGNSGTTTAGGTSSSGTGNTGTTAANGTAASGTGSTGTTAANGTAASGTGNTGTTVTGGMSSSGTTKSNTGSSGTSSAKSSGNSSATSSAAASGTVKTGDTANIALWGSLLAVTAVLLGLLILRSRKH